MDLVTGSSPAHSADIDPLPLLLVRRGPVSMRQLGALQDDRRLELFVVDELTPEWVAFAHRVTAVMVATVGDPLAALLYLLTAGITRHIVVAHAVQYKKDSRDLLSAGASSCITMPITRADVDRLLRGDVMRSGLTRVEPTLRLVLDPVARNVRYHDKTVRLSQREFAVLHCLSNYSGRAVPADKLFMQVWGDTQATTQRQLLDVYICQLRKKLEQLGLKGAISTVRGFGYALAQATRNASHGELSAR